jgi:hypothetical protein
MFNIQFRPVKNTLGAVKTKGNHVNFLQIAG